MRTNQYYCLISLDRLVSNKCDWLFRQAHPAERSSGVGQVGGRERQMPEPFMTNPALVALQNDIFLGTGSSRRKLLCRTCDGVNHHLPCVHKSSVHTKLCQKTTMPLLSRFSRGW